MVRFWMMLAALVVAVSTVVGPAQAKVAMRTFPCWRVPGRVTSIRPLTVRSGLPRNPRANLAASIPGPANRI